MSVEQLCAVVLLSLSMKWVIYCVGWRRSSYSGSHSEVMSSDAIIKDHANFTWDFSTSNAGKCKSKCPDNGLWFPMYYYFPELKKGFLKKRKTTACGFPQSTEIFKKWIFGLSLVKPLHYLKGKVLQIIFKRWWLIRKKIHRF